MRARSAFRLYSHSAFPPEGHYMSFTACWRSQTRRLLHYVNEYQHVAMVLLSPDIASLIKCRPISRGASASSADRINEA